VFRLILVLLVASFSLFLIPPGIVPVYAASPLYVKTVVGSQTAVTITGVSAGDFLGVMVWAGSFGGFSTFTISDNGGDSYASVWSAGATLTGAFWATAKTAGTITITIGCTPGGCSFSGGTVFVDQITNVATVLGGTYHANCGGSCATGNGQDALQSSIVAGAGTAAWEAITVTNFGAGATTLTAVSATSDGISPAPQSQNTCQGPATQQKLCSYTSSLTANFPIFRVNYASSGASSTSSDHGDVILQGGTSATSSSTSACYGNCGSPAVTLINANATHTVNFNVSITLLYVFQSNVNGFIINVTTNLAKAYVNGFHLGMAVYTANCPVNVAPFSQQCSGIVAISSDNLVNQKGRASMPSINTPISNGEWIAIAVAGQFSGLDLNETNSICATACLDSGHLQYTNGFDPSILSGVARCTGTGSACDKSGIDATGLWAWVTGTTVTGVPPPTTTLCTNNFAQLDCMLPAMVNGLCSVVNASCQTSSALLWIIILSFISFLLLTVGFASAHVTKFVAAGDVFMFVFLGWFFIFAGIGLLQSFIIIFFLFIGAIAFGKSARGYF
jgi:hypothetical protein